jgi:BirA family biotin operon repressor/biotin-[acetyl-CoA-carboxylase] ligase
MSDETLETDARLGRALVALEVWRARGREAALGTGEWAAAAGVAEGDAMKLARQLRELGVEVSGSEAEGWRLLSESDVALPEVLEAKIAGTIFAGGVHHFARIGSTNSVAMRAGAEGEVNGLSGEFPLKPKEGLNGSPGRGTVWLAEEQTAGKGRAGHQWKSNPGDGIYCSALLRPSLSPADVIILSLAAGLAVVEAVQEVTGLWGDLRWPNDVLMGGRKFCGILTELNAEVTRVRYVVVGIGLNVNNPKFPPELEAIATSLRIEAGKRFSRVELISALLRALDREQAALHSGLGAARENILRRFEKYSSYCCGCAVAVEEDGGYEGVTRGLDDRGFLRVETGQGMRTVLSGGVRKR